MLRKSFRRPFLSALAIFCGIASFAMERNKEPVKLKAEGEENNISIVFDFNNLDSTGNSQRDNCTSYGLISSGFDSKEMQIDKPTYNFGWKNGKYSNAITGKKYTYVMKDEDPSIFYNTSCPYLENYYISKLEVAQNPYTYDSSKVKANILLALSKEELSTPINYEEGNPNERYFEATGKTTNLFIEGSAQQKYQYFQIRNCSTSSLSYVHAYLYIDKITITYTPIDLARLSSYIDIDYSGIDYSKTLGPVSDANNIVTMEKVAGLNKTGTALKLDEYQSLRFKASSEYAILGIRIAFASREKKGNTLLAGASMSSDQVDNDEKLILSSPKEFSNSHGGVFEWNPKEGEFYNEIYIENGQSESDSSVSLVPKSIQIWASKVIDSHFSLGRLSEGSRFIRFEGAMASWAIVDYFRYLSEYGFEVSYNGTTIKQFNSIHQKQVSSLYSERLIDDDNKYSFDEGYSSIYKKQYFYTYGFILEEIPATFSGDFTFTSYAIISEKEVITSSQSITLNA